MNIVVDGYNICVKTMMILDALTPIITNIEIDR